MSRDATLIVPGFNGGNPLMLLDFDCAAGMRTAGNRSGRIADWSGHFDLESESLAQALNDHLDHSFEEGHSGISEITEVSLGAVFKFEGVTVRHRGGVKYGFNAFSRTRA